MLLLHQSALVFVFSAKWAIYIALLARGLNNYVSQSESKAKAKRLEVVYRLTKAQCK